MRKMTITACKKRLHFTKTNYRNKTKGCSGERPYVSLLPVCRSCSVAAKRGVLLGMQRPSSDPGNQTALSLTFQGPWTGERSVEDCRSLPRVFWPVVLEPTSGWSLVYVHVTQQTSTKVQTCNGEEGECSFSVCQVA